MHKEHGTSRGSKPVCIGDLCMGLISHLHRSPPPPQPSAAPVPTPKPPKVTTPSPFSGTQDNLDRFKAECSLYLSMRRSEFPDEHSNILFILSYMKGGWTHRWTNQPSTLRSKFHIANHIPLSTKPMK